MPSKLSNVLTPKTKCQDILNLPKKKKNPKPNNQMSTRCFLHIGKQNSIF